MSKSDLPPASPISAVRRYSFTHARRSTRTFEAFAEVIDKLVRSFDRWCAQKEEAICMAGVGIGPLYVVSLLELEKSLRDVFSETFDVLLGLLCKVVSRVTQSNDTSLAVWTFTDLPKRIPPAAMMTLLLDSLLQSIQEYSSMGDIVVSDSLLKVFCDTAEPLWVMVHRWLKDGMPIRDHVPILQDQTQAYTYLSEEFCIEDSELSLLDPDFWSDAFVLRDGDDDAGRASAVPVFLQPIAPHILSAGKAVGLLHCLGMPIDEYQSSTKWLGSWHSVGILLGSTKGGCPTTGWDLSRMSADNFARVVYDELLGSCVVAEQALTRVLFDDCDLWQHLTTTEELYLMRRGDIMSNFLDVLFARVRYHYSILIVVSLLKATATIQQMDSSKTWNDFHFLNTAFGDIVTHLKWIDPSLVRISHRGNRDQTNSRSVRALEGLFIEYAVPFPLTYIWGPRSMQIYSTIFVFVAQIRRAKNALERILVRHSRGERSHAGMKVFYAMRGKLFWFVK
jgi:gamma-tubulin complex component 5